jgi:hypothetical protein
VCRNEKIKDNKKHENRFLRNVRNGKEQVFPLEALQEEHITQHQEDPTPLDSFAGYFIFVTCCEVIFIRTGRGSSPEFSIAARAWASDMVKSPDISVLPPVISS